MFLKTRTPKPMLNCKYVETLNDFLAASVLNEYLSSKLGVQKLCVQHVVLLLIQIFEDFNYPL